MHSLVGATPRVNLSFSISVMDTVIQKQLIIVLQINLNSSDLICFRSYDSITKREEVFLFFKLITITLVSTVQSNNAHCHYYSV